MFSIPNQTGSLIRWMLLEPLQFPWVCESKQAALCADLLAGGFIAKAQDPRAVCDDHENGQALR